MWQPLTKNAKKEIGLNKQFLAACQHKSNPDFRMVRLCEIREDGKVYDYDALRMDIGRFHFEAVYWMPAPKLPLI